MDESAKEQNICGGHAGFVHMGYHTAAKFPSINADALRNKTALPHLYIHANAEAELNQPERPETIR